MNPVYEKLLRCYESVKEKVAIQTKSSPCDWALDLVSTSSGNESGTDIGLQPDPGFSRINSAWS